MSSFLSGLNDELRSMVKMLQLVTVRQTVEKARLHELSLDAFAKKHRLSQRGFRMGWLGFTGGGQKAGNSQVF